MNRKIVRNIIYIGVFITFPHLPLSGVKVLMELSQGVIMGSKGVVANRVKEEVTHEIKDVVLKPFGFIPELFHKFNPFQ